MTEESLSTTVRSTPSDAPASRKLERGSESAPQDWAPSSSVPAKPGSGVRLGSVPINSQQELRFLQDRLALCGQIIFSISSMFLVVVGGLHALGQVYSMPLMARVFHVLATSVAFVLWRACRSRRVFSKAVLNALDMGATWAACLSYTLMGHLVMQPWGYYTALLAVAHVTIGRGVIMPSTPLRTLLLTIGCFAGVVLSPAVRLELPILEPTLDVSLHSFVDMILWSASATALASVTSKVIYGLSEKAIEARQLGQYTLEQKIGEGGMGEIFRARHAMLRRPTAIKLMTGDGSEAALRRFEKEVQLTARLTHPNTISIFDYGRTPDGRFYYAMELLDGLTLEELVAQAGPLPPGRVIHILLQVCGALREAHGVGLIHRDIKPANIYICPRGGSFDIVKVLDFGLVREFANGVDITRSNIDIIVGTPLYISPEAIVTPAQIDARADIYALGAVAYFLLTGSPPFAGKTLVELCGQHLHNAPVPPSERIPGGLASDLEHVVLACLAKEPAWRPQNVQAVAEALRGCRDAGTWSEGDAEAWWRDSARPPSRGASKWQSTEACHTLFCPDVKERLKRAGAR
jgi:hypothetical protein